MLKHVYVYRGDKDGQNKKPYPRHTPHTIEQQAASAEQFKDTADKHSRAGPWNVRRHYANLDVSEHEVRYPTNSKPQKDKG